MSALIYRGLRLFFQNKSMVIGSFVGALIVLLLYVFLLGDNLVSDLAILDRPALAVDTFMLSGVIGISSASSCLGSVSLMIRDKERGVFTDFMVSPLKGKTIMFGYFLSSLLISFLIALVTTIFAEIYLVVFSEGELLSRLHFSALLGATFLASLCSTSLMFWLATFFRRMDSFSSIITIIGPLIGFITGSYVPIGSMPEIAQQVVKYFPLTSGVVLIRKILTAGVYTSSVPEAIAPIKEELGIIMNYHWETMTPVLILLGLTIVFLGLATLNVNKYTAKR